MLNSFSGSTQTPAWKRRGSTPSPNNQHNCENSPPPEYQPLSEFLFDVQEKSSSLYALSPMESAGRSFDHLVICINTGYCLGVDESSLPESEPNIISSSSSSSSSSSEPNATRSVVGVADKVQAPVLCYTTGASTATKEPKHPPGGVSIL